MTTFEVNPGAAMLARLEAEARSAGPHAAISIPTAQMNIGAVEPMTKERLLDKAKEAVADRGLSYGKPEDNFNRIALRWRTHLKNRFGVEVAIDAASVAIMMDDMKTARLENDITHLDSWVDKAGYAACGAEIAIKE